MPKAPPRYKAKPGRPKKRCCGGTRKVWVCPRCGGRGMKLLKSGAHYIRECNKCKYHLT